MAGPVVGTEPVVRADCRGDQRVIVLDRDQDQHPEPQVSAGVDLGVGIGDDAVSALVADGCVGDLVVDSGVRVILFEDAECYLFR